MMMMRPVVLFLFINFTVFVFNISLTMDSFRGGVVKCEWSQGGKERGASV